MKGGTLVGGAVLALLLFGLSERAGEGEAVRPLSQLEGGGPAWRVTVYDDDPVRGAAECRQREVEYAPAVCTVEPEASSPDVSQPGWAESSGPVG